MRRKLTRHVAGPVEEDGVQRCARCGFFILDTANDEIPFREGVLVARKPGHVAVTGSRLAPMCQPKGGR